MIDDKKSTDLGLSAAERKTLRNREARKAIVDYEEAQRAVHGNLERLREERLAREAAAGPMLYPAPELPDDTPIENVRFSTRVRNALITAGLKTVGEIREASDAMLFRISERGLSLIFGRRWAFPQPMGSGPWAKSPRDLAHPGKCFRSFDRARRRRDGVRRSRPIYKGDCRVSLA